jgi:hypothetical protein
MQNFSSLTVLDHFTEKSFHRNFLTESTFDRIAILPKKVIWTKKKLSKGRLTENIWKMVI